MKAQTRRAVAYTVAQILTGNRASAIYDYAEQKYYNFSPPTNTSNFSVYDYTEKCFIGGNMSGHNQYSLFHYGTRKYLTLCIRDNQFDGFDYDSKSFYSGNASASGISIYDYEHKKYFQFST